MDSHASQPIGGQCEPDTAPVTASDTLYFTGRIFMRCIEGKNVMFENIDGSKLQTELSMYYHLIEI